MNILVVDDSPVDRMLAAHMLADDGRWSVLEAGDGREALNVLESADVSVVVTDLQMPELNGLELLQQIQARWPLVPVVLMTAKGNEEIAVQALQQGAASYVPKRRLAAELRRTVEHIWSLATADETNFELSRRLTDFKARYEIENNLPLLMSLAAELPGEACNFWECDSTLRMQLSVALEEALTNAYFYGSLGLEPSLKTSDPNQFYALAEERKFVAEFRDRKIIVSADFSREQATFVITDEGPGFDVDEFADLTATTDLDAPRGRGLRLMKTFLDQVSYNSRGNEVTLVKRRPRQPESREP